MRSEQRSRFKSLRPLLFAIGVLLPAVSVSVEVLKIGTPGFGILQVMLVGAGAATIAVAWLGRRSIALHQSIAFAILPTIVLVGLLELGSSSLLGIIGPRPSPMKPIREAYFASQPWGDQYERDLTNVPAARFTPYVVWIGRSYSSETINVDSMGVRRTPGAICTEGAYRVFVFGGSTVWGWGVPDWGTIPAYLQASLDRRLQSPVCVMNFGLPGYVSTQSVLRLLGLLRTSIVPDLVVFYDGINEVNSAYREGRAGVYYLFGDIKAKVEGEQSLAAQLVARSRLVALIRRIKPAPPEGSLDIDDLSDEIAAAFRSNIKTVRALAHEYGFRYEFFWQPAASVDPKPLTPGEEVIRSAIPNTLSALYRATYDLMLDAQGNEHEHNLIDVFAEQSWQVYFDDQHLVPEANDTVARNMVQVMVSEGGLRADSFSTSSARRK